jgi:hypothetical protein
MMINMTIVYFEVSVLISGFTAGSARPPLGLLASTLVGVGCSKRMSLSAFALITPVNKILSHERFILFLT